MSEMSEEDFKKLRKVLSEAFEKEMNDRKNAFTGIESLWNGEKEKVIKKHLQTESPTITTSSKRSKGSIRIGGTYVTVDNAPQTPVLLYNLKRKGTLI